MTGPLPVGIGIRLVVGATAIALVVSAGSDAESHFARFHVRGRHAAGVARRQSSLEFYFCADFSVEIVGRCLSDASVKSWDAFLLGASVGLARIQLRVCDDARVSRDADFLKLP